MNVLKHIYFWVDERLEMHDYIKKDILDKPIPKGLNLSYCFGGITFFLFVMLAVTGYFMTLYYVPSPEEAYDAVEQAAPAADGGAAEGGHEKEQPGDEQYYPCNGSHPVEDADLLGVSLKLLLIGGRRRAE